MLVKSRLMIAAAILAGTASTAFAQTAQFDWTGDKTTSYGRTQSSAATATPNPAQSPIAQDPFNPNDPTSDKYLSYGGRPAR